MAGALGFDAGAYMRHQPVLIADPTNTAKSEFIAICNGAGCGGQQNSHNEPWILPV